MLEKLREIICEFADVKPEDITEETNIRTDLALDSLSLLNLAVEIENEFELEVSDRDAMNLETVGDVMALIEAKG
ncbi:MAG: phosphopantetheine-binding protein [Acutalibacteraceae bacterium]